MGIFGKDATPARVLEVPADVFLLENKVCGLCSTIYLADTPDDGKKFACPMCQLKIQMTLAKRAEMEASKEANKG